MRDGGLAVLDEGRRPPTSSLPLTVPTGQTGEGEKGQDKYMGTLGQGTDGQGHTQSGQWPGSVLRLVKGN